MPPQGCSLHANHVHEDSALSGVFYVDAPAGSGSIVFDDPRGPRPPFARNRLAHPPSSGEVLLFPPWLSHGVAPSSCGASDARIALSFNVVARAASAGQPSANWELLADVSLAFPPAE